MTVRSTYALDPETARLIKHLAGDWEVSQAEVIRRSVRKAAMQTEVSALSPADVVAHYRSRPLPRTREETRREVKRQRSLRHADDAHRKASRSS
ncbi:MAG: hypothetical protein ACRES7_02065 [Gammaproteobacteria bacterium]